MFNQWARKLEQLRIRKHFERTERLLLSQDTTALTPEAQAARQLHIIHLRSYRENGVFPRNYQHDYQNPCFIDREGRVCAVGYLLVTSGQSTLARSIADAQNDAYVDDMTSPELLKWAHDTGLSKDELATIQPGYSPEAIFNNANVYSVPMVTAAILLGGFSLRRNWRHIQNKQRTIFGFILGIIAVALALFLAENYASMLPMQLNGIVWTPDFSYPPAPPALIMQTISYVVLLVLFSLVTFVAAVWALFPKFRLRRSAALAAE